mgnify:FL=1
MGPVGEKERDDAQIREVTDLLDISASKIRPIQLKDFVAAFRTVRSGWVE